jgi:hypothetical protein
MIRIVGILNSLFEHDDLENSWMNHILEVLSIMKNLFIFIPIFL